MAITLSGLIRCAQHVGGWRSFACMINERLPRKPLPGYTAPVVTGVPRTTVLINPLSLQAAPHGRARQRRQERAPSPLFRCAQLFPAAADDQAKHRDQRNGESESHQIFISLPIADAL